MKKNTWTIHSINHRSPIKERGRERERDSYDVGCKRDESSAFSVVVSSNSSESKPYGSVCLNKKREIVMQEKTIWFKESKERRNAKQLRCR
jgi:hypothetical protein